MAEKVGQACDNAAGEGNEVQPGVCKQAMCTRATPDGSVTYACYRCVAEGEGAGGQSGEAGGEGGRGGSTPAAGSGGASASGASAGGTAGTKTATGGSSADPSNDSGGGCSVSQAGGGAGALAALVAVGLAAVGLLRRRTS